MYWWQELFCICMLMQQQQLYGQNKAMVVVYYYYGKSKSNVYGQRKTMVAFYSKSNGSFLWQKQQNSIEMQCKSMANAVLCQREFIAKQCSNRSSSSFMAKAKQRLPIVAKAMITYYSKSNGSANPDLWLMQVYYSFGYSNNSLESQLLLLMLI